MKWAYDVSLKQKEAYGRYAHGLSGVCCIGFVIILFTETPILAALLKMPTLAVFAVVLFLTDAILSKGE